MPNRLACLLGNQFLKLLEPALVDKVDEIMVGKAGWQKGLMTVTDAGWPVLRPPPPAPPPSPPPVPPEPTPGSGPKAVLFLLDVSYSMDGVRLDSCKKALEDIYNDNLGDMDKLALVTFKSSARIDLEWTTKAGSAGRAVPLFRSLHVRGLTRMFDGLELAINMTKQDGGMPDFANWIVLLCAGATMTVSIPLSVNMRFTFLCFTNG